MIFCSEREGQNEKLDPISGQGPFLGAHPVFHVTQNTIWFGFPTTKFSMSVPRRDAP